MNLLKLLELDDLAFAYTLNDMKKIGGPEGIWDNNNLIFYKPNYVIFKKDEKIKSIKNYYE